MYKSKGFSLIEFSIVVAVMSILAGGAMAGKGFMDAAKITQVASAVETTRVGVETLVARRGGQWHHEEGGVISVIHDDLIARNLVPEMPWRIGDIDISFVLVTQSYQNPEAMHDHDNHPIYILATGPEQQLKSLLERMENHAFFLNAQADHPRGCTQKNAIQNAGQDYGAILCFERSL